MRMSAPRACEIAEDGVLEQRAAQAWLEFTPEGAEPLSVEVLQRRRHSAVLRLAGVGRDGAAVIAKRCRSRTAHLERLIYQELLPRSGMPALRCHGVLPEPEGELCWLFMDEATGARYSTQRPDHRTLAGCWLAATQLANVPVRLERVLPNRDLDHYAELLRHCRAALLRHPCCHELPVAEAATLKALVSHFERLESQWRDIARTCALMPRTLVHDDLAIKHLRVREMAGGPALLVFDWEFAGFGVPAADLAQSIDRIAAPDLDAYGAVVRRNLPRLRAGDVEALAACGNVLRLLNQVGWALTGLERAKPPQLSYAISMLRPYEPSLAEVSVTLRRSFR